MTKQELEQELEETRRRFTDLVNAIPEENYSLPTDNPAWTVGDVLHHITLGPRAIALEIWLIVHAGWAFGFTMRHFPSRMFNRVNAWFGNRRRRISRQRLLNAYGKAHTVILSELRRTREEDLRKSVTYPAEFVPDLAGEVTPERLFRYVSGHLEMHVNQIYRLDLQRANSGIIPARDWSC